VTMYLRRTHGLKVQADNTGRDLVLKTKFQYPQPEKISDNVECSKPANYTKHHSLYSR
jgi:hypothetical protein